MQRPRAAIIAWESGRFSASQAMRFCRETCNRQGWDVVEDRVVAGPTPVGGLDVVTLPSLKKEYEILVGTDWNGIIAALVHSTYLHAPQVKGREKSWVATVLATSRRFFGELQAQGVRIYLASEQAFIQPETMLEGMEKLEPVFLDLATGGDENQSKRGRETVERARAEGKQIGRPKKKAEQDP